MGGLTVMDVRGVIQLEQFTTQDSTPEFETIRVGYTWLDKNIAAAADGSIELPVPLQLGTRDAPWIQQWELLGVADGTANVEAPLTPLETSGKRDIHVRNMRKQPTADAKLMLVVSGGTGYGTSSVALKVALLIMLALP